VHDFMSRLNFPASQATFRPQPQFRSKDALYESSVEIRAFPSATHWPSTSTSVAGTTESHVDLHTCFMTNSFEHATWRSS